MSESAVAAAPQIVSKPGPILKPKLLTIPDGNELDIPYIRLPLKHTNAQINNLKKDIFSRSNWLSGKFQEEIMYK